MKLYHTDHFKKRFTALPEDIQRRAEKALHFLLADLRHPSLRAIKMEGENDPQGRDIWEARITRGYRFTFAIDKETETYILYRVGGHDIERRPG